MIPRNLKRFLLVGAGLAVLAFVGIKALQVTLRREHIQNEIVGLEREIAALQAQSGALHIQLQDLERPEAIEQEARQRLNVSKEGEKTIVLVPHGEQGNDASLDSEAVSVPSSDDTKEIANPIKWWRKFFGP